MPDWSDCTLTILGPPEAIDHLLRCAAKADNAFSLDALIPRPETLRRSGVPPEGVLEWACVNWGTKWDTFETRAQRHRPGATVRFATAWSPPLAALDSVADEWPMLTFKLKFAVESDTGRIGLVQWFEGVRIGPTYLHALPAPHLTSYNPEAFLLECIFPAEGPVH
jgi:hypothetical protein